MQSRPDRGAPIVGRTYDLCAELYQHVDRFPRAQRTLLGREVGRMLGGWLKHERSRDLQPKHVGDASQAASKPAVAEPARAARGTGARSALPQRASADRKGAVRCTMQSPLVERYLAAKLAHPGALVLVAAGAFCQALFEDAELLGRELGLRVRDLAADAEPERIFACGIPKARLERLSGASRASRMGGARGVGGRAGVPCLGARRRRSGGL